MDKTAVGLDQLRVFATVVDNGSFSSAARKLGRAQSAVTYAIQKLEAEVGSPLFDRSAYRPTLSESGQALLPYARRVLEEALAFQRQMQSLSIGMEAEISIVADSVFPTNCLIKALRAFDEMFPAVQTHIFVGSLAPPSQLVLDGSADIGLIVTFADPPPGLILRSVDAVEFLPVAAPAHPLASLQQERRAPLREHDVRDHLQLILAQRSYHPSDTTFTISTRSWRLADLSAKRAMLLAGVGWGYMPRHVVKDSLESGCLVELEIEKLGGFRQPSMVPAVVAHQSDRMLGPAGRWLFEHLQISSSRE